jgi:hypothetical protein
MARSSRFFLLGLVVACGVQVFLDWNATLREINVLRDGIRQKGENYVGILGKASDDELGARDTAGLERLSHGIFDDDDAAYVRFTDASGAVVWERLKPELAEELGGSASFAAEYGPLMARDTAGALHDPEGLKRRVANSKYKDFAQTWTDAADKLTAMFSKPREAAPNRGVVIYQDRLRDQSHHKDDRVTYAIATVVGDAGADIGTVIVAFDMRRTNEAVRVKFMKFAGVCTFFVGLALFQNIVSRRNKLWLLDLQARYAAAKQALREAMPAADDRKRGLVVSGAVDQAKGPVDGMVWAVVDEGDQRLVLVVDPDGDGVDAAAVGLHVVRAFKARRRDQAPASLEAEMDALGQAALEIPLTRPLEAMLLRIDSRTGEYGVLAGSLAQLRLVGGDSVEAVALSPSDAKPPSGIVGPLFARSGALETGRCLLGVCSNASKGDPVAFADAVARYVARTHEQGKIAPVQDAAIWARGKNAALVQSDIAVIAVARQTA